MQVPHALGGQSRLFRAAPSAAMLPTNLQIRPRAPPQTPSACGSRSWLVSRNPTPLTSPPLSDLHRRIEFSRGKLLSVIANAAAGSGGVGASAGSTNGASTTYAPKTEPSEHVLTVWRRADAVCFDIDCTITVNDALDLLAKFMGVSEAVEKLTSRAMDGTLALAQSLEERLALINCTPSDIKNFLDANPPQSRLAPNVERLIKQLQARGVAIYLITGGFREMAVGIADYLGIPHSHVYANTMVWEWDYKSNSPTRLKGLDVSQPTCKNQGKVAAISEIRARNPYNTVIMIGDGITDLEAVAVTGGADLFIGYGGVVERAAVAAAAEWFIYDYAQLLDAMKRHKVAMVGSGAWASAAVHIVAQNVRERDPDNQFHDTVKMWVFEEDVDGRKLTDIINETHHNEKYLPGVDLGDNVQAVPELLETVSDADIIILCTPHQFVHRIVKQMVGKIKSDAVAISLIKGMRVRTDGPQLISQMVSRNLDIDCSVLMGANIASDIGREELSEAVIGYNKLQNGELLKQLFNAPYFSINLVRDVVGAEMCGTLKNIVAVAAGMCDGIGLGPNSKATIIRQGLVEMRQFSRALYPAVQDDTFFEGCGVGDLIASCYGGRNRLVSEAWAKSHLAGESKSFEELEHTLLNGQKLQGVLTSNEVQEILKVKGWEADYPLFTTVNRIISGAVPPTQVQHFLEIGRRSYPSPPSSDDEELKHSPPPSKQPQVMPEPAGSRK